MPIHAAMLHMGSFVDDKWQFRTENRSNYILLYITLIRFYGKFTTVTIFYSSDSAISCLHVHELVMLTLKKSPVEQS